MKKYLITLLAYILTTFSVSMAAEQKASAKLTKGLVQYIANDVSILSRNFLQASVKHYNDIRNTPEFQQKLIKEIPQIKSKELKHLILPPIEIKDKVFTVKVDHLTLQFSEMGFFKKQFMISGQVIHLNKATNHKEIFNAIITHPLIIKSEKKTSFFQHLLEPLISKASASLVTTGPALATTIAAFYYASLDLKSEKEALNQKLEFSKLTENLQESFHHCNNSSASPDNEISTFESYLELIYPLATFNDPLKQDIAAQINKIESSHQKFKMSQICHQVFKDHLALAVTSDKMKIEADGYCDTIEQLLDCYTRFEDKVSQRTGKNEIQDSNWSLFESHSQRQ